MPSSNVKSLIGKLNDTCRQALESSAGLCLSQTHYEVDLEHFLIKLLEMPQTDVQQILRHFEINQDRLTADLTRAMEGFKTGNARNPALSPRIPRMVQEAWVLASIGGAPKIINQRDNNRWLRIGNQDGYEIRVGYYAQVGCRKPGWNCRIAL